MVNNILRMDRKSKINTRIQIMVLANSFYYEQYFIILIKFYLNII